MMNGLDSIGLTLQHDDPIAAYEAKQPAFYELSACPSNDRAFRYRPRHQTSLTFAVKNNAITEITAWPSRQQSAPNFVQLLLNNASQNYPGRNTVSK